MKPSSTLPAIAASIHMACLLCRTSSVYHAYLLIQQTESAEITSTYAIIPEGSQYVFDIYEPNLEYHAIKGLSAWDTIEKTEMFVGWHPWFILLLTRTILKLYQYTKRRL